MPEKNVSTPVDAYNDMAAMWELPCDLVEGTRAMREKGTRYLPMNGITVDEKGRAISPIGALEDRNTGAGTNRWVGETRQAYENRVERTTLYSFYYYTLLSLRGKVFSKPVTVDAESPANIKEWADNNIDLEGNSLNSFGRNVFLEGINLGLSHIFVDMPTLMGDATRADQINSGSRPYFLHIHAKDLIGWRFEKVDAGYELVQLRFRETVEVEDGDFDMKVVNRIRLCEMRNVNVPNEDGPVPRMVVTIYTQDDKKDDEWVAGEPMVTGIWYIPLATFYTNQTGRLMAKPAMMALADKNLEHWQATSDQKTIVNTGRVPILFQSGDQSGGESLIVGAYKLVFGPEGSDMKYVEVSGHGAEIGWRDLEMITEQMDVLSMAPVLNQHTGQVTATEAAIDTVVSSSSLQAWAISFKSTLETAFQYMSDWINSPAKVLVNLDTENNLLVLHSDDWDQLRKDVEAGILSMTTYRQIVQDRQYWPMKIDLELEQQRLKNERPQVSVMPTGQGSGNGSSTNMLPPVQGTTLQAQGEQI